MSRPLVRVHTIEEWLDLDSGTQALILQNIKLKDRLNKFLLNQNKIKKPAGDQGEWMPCKRCEKKGWVFREPRRPGIHPSGLGQPCLLKVYNEMVGKENRESIDPALRLTFDLGHQVHHMFQSYGEAGAWGSHYIKEAPIGADYQEVAEQLMMEGHADADNILVIDEIPNHPIYEVGIVHEYKTIKQELFDKLTRPKPEHMTQASCYSAALNRPIVAYLYFSKNNSQLADFPVPFNPMIWKSVYDRATLLKQHFQNETPPEGNPGYHCRNCGFIYDCSYAKMGKK